MAFIIGTSTANMQITAAGTTATRPSSPSAGIMRYNTTNNNFEVYTGSDWTGFGGADLIPPVTSGLTVVLNGNSWSSVNNRWEDVSGNNNHTSYTAGSIGVASSSNANGATKTFNYIYGDTNSGVRITSGWNSGGDYTFFHVSRTTGTRRRIWQAASNSSNWLSGHWSGQSGKFYHEGWMSDSSTDYHGNNWILVTDQRSLARTNKGAYSFTGGGGSPNSIGINAAAASGCCPTETSDWACAFVAIYNRALSSSEYISVENWIWNKYFQE